MLRLNFHRLSQQTACLLTACLLTSGSFLSGSFGPTAAPRAEAATLTTAQHQPLTQWQTADTVLTPTVPGALPPAVEAVLRGSPNPAISAPPTSLELREDRAAYVATWPLPNAHPLHRVTRTEVEVLEAAENPSQPLTGTPDLQWHTFLGGSDPDDGAYRLTPDADGNMYVSGDSGYTWGTPIRPYAGRVDAFVAKLDAAGNLVWHTFLGAAVEDDFADRIVLDAAGNVYVVGWSYATWGNPVRIFTPPQGAADVFVAKLDAQGNLVWHTFLGNVGEDWAGGVSLDGNGYLYLSGASEYTWGNPVRPHNYLPETFDGFVAKLNANTGELVWNSFLSGADMGSLAITADAAGNSYITGYAYDTLPWGNPIRPHSGPPDGWDAFIAKLDTNGHLVWNTFLGGASPVEWDFDIGYAIAVGADNTITMIGYSEFTWGDPVEAFHGAGTVPDVLVARLDASGNLLWHTFLGSPSNDQGYDLQVKPNGHTVIAGTSYASWGTPIQNHQGRYDGFVAELDATGQLLWNTFMGGKDVDLNIGLGLDPAGNVLAVGYNAESWGNPQRAYSGGFDGMVVKLDATGHLLWNTFLGGGLGDTGIGWDDSGGVTVDAAGNTYVTGLSSTPWEAGQKVKGLTDAFVAKVNPQGQLVWNVFLGSDDPEIYEHGLDIVATAAGEVYVVGVSGLWGTPRNTGSAFVAKLDPNGQVVWNTFLGASGAAYSIADAVALVEIDGPHGSRHEVVVAGLSMGTWGNPIRPFGGAIDGFVAKLDSQGYLQWHTFLGGSSIDYGDDIVATGDGHIAVSGISAASWGTPVSPMQNPGDAYAAKLTLAGALVWNTFLEGRLAMEDAGDYGFVGADALGNIFVTGGTDHSWGNPVRAYSGGYSDAFVAKLNAQGQRVWNTFLGGIGEDAPRGLHVNRDGEAVISGYSSYAWGNPTRPYAGKTDAFAAKLGVDGTLKWNTFVGGPQGDDNRGVVVDSNMQVYVLGTSADTWGTPVRAFHGGYGEVFLAKLNDLQAPVGLNLTHNGAHGVFTPLSLTATLTQGTGVTYTWNFGDGTPLLVGPSALTHQYVQPGDYTITVTATNSVGSQSASTQVNIFAQSVLFLPMVRRP